jgi:hypothetical protein
MAAAFVPVVDARCPLCGASLLTIGRTGRVTLGDLHAVPLRKGHGEGYMLCDECAVLAEMPHDLTLN